MANSTFVSRIAFLVFSYLGAVALPSQAQTGSVQYGASYVAPATNVTDPGQAADGNTSTAATLQPVTVGIIGQPASERVKFASTIPAGAGQSGLYIQVQKLLNPVLGNTIDASLFNTSKVNAYLGDKMVQSWSLGGLLKATVMKENTTTTVPVTPNYDFDQLELVLDGTLSGYSTQLFEAFAPAPGPLPVELVGFQGKAAASGVQLSWQTASELRSSYFVVERADGSEAGGFAAIGQVAAAGSSAQAHSYQFRDAEPLPLGYYRLRQVDADGTTSFSPVVVVRAAPAVATLAAYPSPATETVQLTGPANSPVAIYDQQGRLLRQATVGQLLDIRSLPAGLYLVRDAATGSSTRFVKSL